MFMSPEEKRHRDHGRRQAVRDTCRCFACSVLLIDSDENNETLKWLTQLPTLMQNHSGGDSVAGRC